jgi:Ca2+-binding EF-hand superfamily protein
MATRKINQDALIKKVFKKVNKDLGVAAKTPPAQMKSFNDKLKAAPTPFLYRIKDVWKAFTALMAGFFTIGFIVARLTIPTETVIQTASISPDAHYFNAADTNGDGQLSLAEVESGHTTWGNVKFILPNLDDFKMFDHNNDGQLNLAEAQSINGKFVAPDRYDFKAFDNDNDGQLNLAEAQSLKEALAIKQFEFADKDSDGKLNYEESTHALHPFTQNQFAKLDKNEDRQLTFDEIDQDIAFMNEQQFNQLDLNQDGKLDYAEAQMMFIIIIVEG